MNCPINFIYRYRLARIIRRHRITLTQRAVARALSGRCRFCVWFTNKTHHMVATRELKRAGLWEE